MVDDVDETAERLTQPVGGAELRIHVGVFGFRSRDRPVERVERDLGDRTAGNSFANSINQAVNLFDQFQTHRLKEEGHGLVKALCQLRLPPSLNSLLDASAALKRAIDDGALHDL